MHGQTHRDGKITEILKSLLSDVEQKIMCKPVIPSWMEGRRNRGRRVKQEGSSMWGGQDESWKELPAHTNICNTETPVSGKQRSKKLHLAPVIYYVWDKIV